MSFLNKVLLLNQKKIENEIEIPPIEVPPVEEINIFTNNFNPYSSSGNLNGISYSSSASGNIENRTITHICNGFSSSSAFIFTGFEVGKTYIYTLDIVGSLENTFMQAECLTQSNVALSDSGSIIGIKKLEFTVVANTFKLRIRLGTASMHTGTSVFSNIKIVEKK